MDNLHSLYVLVQCLSVHRNTINTSVVHQKMWGRILGKLLGKLEKSFQIYPENATFNLSLITETKNKKTQGYRIQEVLIALP